MSRFLFFCEQQVAAKLHAWFNLLIVMINIEKMNFLKPLNKEFADFKAKMQLWEQNAS